MLIYFIKFIPGILFGGVTTTTVGVSPGVSPCADGEGVGFSENAQIIRHNNI